MIISNIKSSIKWFRNTLLLLCCFIGLNGLHAQCSFGIDTICVNEPDTLFINLDPKFTSLNWSTNNGTTLTVLPGDTLVIVDWSTSSILNAVDSVCVVGATASACMDTLYISTYLKECITPCLATGLDKDNDGIPDAVDVDDDNDGILDDDECPNRMIMELVSAASIDNSINWTQLHTGAMKDTIVHSVALANCIGNTYDVKYEVIASPAPHATEQTICADNPGSLDGFPNATTGDWVRVFVGVGNCGGSDAGVNYRFNFLNGPMPLDISNISHGNFTAGEEICVRSSVPLFVTTTSTGIITGNGTTEVCLDNVNGATGGTFNTWEISSNGVEVSWFEFEKWGSPGQEGFSLPVWDICDTDCDGIPDQFDLDSDNDGIPDAVEACGDITLTLEDCMLDSDGSAMYPDTDMDGWLLKVVAIAIRM